MNPRAHFWLRGLVLGALALGPDSRAATAADERIKGQTPKGFAETRDKMTDALNHPEEYYGYERLFLGALAPSTFYDAKGQVWPLHHYLRIWGTATEFIALNEVEERQIQLRTKTGEKARGEFYRPIQNALLNGDSPLAKAHKNIEAVLKPFTAPTASNASEAETPEKIAERDALADYRRATGRTDSPNRNDPMSYQYYQRQLNKYLNQTMRAPNPAAREVSPSDKNKILRALAAEAERVLKAELNALVTGVEQNDARESRLINRQPRSLAQNKQGNFKKVAGTVLHPWRLLGLRSLKRAEIEKISITAPPSSVDIPPSIRKLFGVDKSGPISMGTFWDRLQNFAMREQIKTAEEARALTPLAKPTAEQVSPFARTALAREVFWSALHGIGTVEPAQTRAELKTAITQAWNNFQKWTAPADVGRTTENALYPSSPAFTAEFRDQLNDVRWEGYSQDADYWKNLEANRKERDAKKLYGVREHVIEQTRRRAKGVVRTAKILLLMAGAAAAQHLVTRVTQTNPVSYELLNHSPAGRDAKFVIQNNEHPRDPVKLGKFGTTGSSVVPQSEAIGTEVVQPATVELDNPNLANHIRRFGLSVDYPATAGTGHLYAVPRLSSSPADSLKIYPSGDVAFSRYTEYRDQAGNVFLKTEPGGTINHLFIASKTFGEYPERKADRDRVLSELVIPEKVSGALSVPERDFSEYTTQRLVPVRQRLSLPEHEKFRKLSFIELRDAAKNKLRQGQDFEVYHAKNVGHYVELSEAAFKKLDGKPLEIYANFVNDHDYTPSEDSNDPLFKEPLSAERYRAYEDTLKKLGVNQGIRDFPFRPATVADAIRTTFAFPSKRSHGESRYFLQAPYRNVPHQTRTTAETALATLVAMETLIDPAKYELAIEVVAEETALAKDEQPGEKNTIITPDELTYRARITNRETGRVALTARLVSVLGDEDRTFGVREDSYTDQIFERFFSPEGRARIANKAAKLGEKIGEYLPDMPKGTPSTDSPHGAEFRGKGSLADAKNRKLREGEASEPEEKTPEEKKSDEQKREHREGAYDPRDPVRREDTEPRVVTEPETPPKPEDPAFVKLREKWQKTLREMKAQYLRELKKTLVAESGRGERKTAPDATLARHFSSAIAAATLSKEEVADMSVLENLSEQVARDHAGLRVMNQRGVASKTLRQTYPIIKYADFMQDHQIAFADVMLSMRSEYASYYARKGLKFDTAPLVPLQKYKCSTYLKGPR